MRTTRVWCSGTVYRMSIGAGVLRQAGDELDRLGFSGRAVVVTDETVGGLFLDELEHSLRDAGFDPGIITIPPGEEQKSLETAGVLYSRLNELAVERSTPLLALGGGVIGDLTGFVAATYFRGLPLVHVPTTLLAQVDSSLGGKVAVNHGMLKNNIGAFHQPVGVLADISTLFRLPEREFRNGLAEVIKSAVIRDEGFLEFLESRMDDVLLRDELVLEKMVAVTAGIKAAVVQEDERDHGLRNILNFGHTVGHGIETASGFTLCHGEGVAIGMVAAAKMSAAMGLLEPGELARLRSLLVRAGLPITMPEGIDPWVVVAAMARDKKRAGGRLRFVLPTRMGEVVIRNDVPRELVEETMLGSNFVA